MPEWRIHFGFKGKNSSVDKRVPINKFLLQIELIKIIVPNNEFFIKNAFLLHA